MPNIRGALVWRGVLALIVGFIAIGWPDITVGAFVILFAIYAFIAAGTSAAAAFRSKGGGRVVLGLLLAVIDIAAGVASLVWPGITALALVWVVAIWAFASGFAEIGMAFAAGESAGQRGLLGLTGLMSVALGVVFTFRPDVGAVTIAQVYGLFSIISGVAALVLAANAGSRQSAPGLATV
jgi:uncharacterized membrane protein HdeD (DUF308 family)